MNDYGNDAYRSMVARLAKPGHAILETLTAEKCHQIHMAMGMSGEVGEIYDALKVFIIHDDFGKIDMKNLIEEFGDYEFYYDGFIMSMGWPVDFYVGRVVAADEYSDDFLYGLVTETANLLDFVKKKTIYNKQEEYDAEYEKCLLSIRQKLDGIYKAFNLTREEIRVANMDKLLYHKNARYSSGSYSDGQAQNRSDKQDEVKQNG